MLAAVSGCDVGPRAAFEPPRVHVVETRPSHGEGMECADSDPDCGVSRRPELVIRYDRPLWPEPERFSEILVYTGSTRVRARVDSVRYDVLERTLTYRLGPRLGPRTLYRVRLPEPTRGAAPRAYDGGELEPGPMPFDFSFFTKGAAAAPEAEPTSARVPSCDEVTALLERHCGSCHGAELPAMGLTLSSPAGLKRTAIRRVARQTETGSGSGVPATHPVRFGTAMPIIEPGRAANSYLVYKLLVNEASFEPCRSAECATFAAEPGASSCGSWSELDREQLRDWFVRGDAMPPAGAGTPLDCASLRALLRFIDDGARCP